MPHYIQMHLTSHSERLAPPTSYPHTQVTDGILRTPGVLPVLRPAFAANLVLDPVVEASLSRPSLAQQNHTEGVSPASFAVRSHRKGL